MVSVRVQIVAFGIDEHVRQFAPHHKGVADQSMSFALAFTTSSLYMGINTIDDTHQNPGSGWNGDTLQIAFTNAARTCRPAT